MITQVKGFPKKISHLGRGDIKPSPSLRPPTLSLYWGVRGQFGKGSPKVIFKVQGFPENILILDGQSVSYNSKLKTSASL